MRYFRGVPTLIQKTQNKFPSTLPTKDPTYTTITKIIYQIKI